MSAPTLVEDEADPFQVGSPGPSAPSGAETVAVDASVLIEFLILDRTDLLRDLPGLEFAIPEAVRAEVRREDQPATLAASLAAGDIRVVRVEALDEIATAERLRRESGAGEAECLPVAEPRGWFVASDEGGRFRRIAIQRLGEARLLTTPGVLLRAIRAAGGQGAPRGNPSSKEMGNPIVRTDARRFPHRMAARIAGAIRAARFRGEGEPSPAAFRAASAREGLSPQPAHRARGEAVLERHRFRMPFASFAERVR